MLHRQVRDAVMESRRVGSAARNAKGNDVKLLDLAANGAALAALRKLRFSVVVDSEECVRREFGSGPPRHRVVLDPVDGSDNWAQGLPLSASSYALLPVDAPLHPDWVEAASVGPLDHDSPLEAAKSLTDRVSLIAASSPELCDEIVEVLGDGGR